MIPIKRASLLYFFFISIICFSQSKKNKAEKLDYYISKSKFFIEKGLEDSIIFYQRKMKPFRSKKDSYKKYLSFLSELGHFYEGSGRFEKSLEVHQEGIAIAEHFNDIVFKSKMEVDISQTYRIFHDHKKAIEYGKKALSTLGIDNSKYLKQKANALDIIAAVYNETNKPDSALVYHKKILSFLPRLDSSDIKATIVNIGYTFMNLNRLDESKLYTERGLNLYKPEKNNYIIGSIYTNLAMYGNRAKKYNYALRMFDSAIYYTKKSKYIETFVWIYDERAQVYKKQNKIKEALKDTELLLKIKDSIFKSQRDKTTQETEAKFQTAKKEKEIAQQKEQLLEQELAIKNRNLYAIILASSLLILGIIFFSIYKRNQLKRKQLQKEIDLKDALATIKTQNRLQEQRLRISRDLHDNIGSQLTFIISSLDNLKFVTKDANSKLKNKLSGISSFTSDTIHQLRDTIWAMNKSEITIEDLHTRILSFVEKAKLATENIEFEINQNLNIEFELTSIEGMNLFRVIQEAINNAIKYAEASKVSISLKNKEKTLYVSIIDNGIGFDLNNVDLGNGLSNIEKRISEINGKVKIVSKKNMGTEIQIICNL